MAVVPFFKKLLFSREFDYSGGRFYLMMRVPGVILPMAGLVRLVKGYYDDAPSKAREQLFKIGYEQGIGAGKRYKIRLGHSFPEYSNFVREVTEVLGLGRPIFNMRDNGDIVMILNPSVLAEEYLKLYGKAKQPFCDYLRGLGTGVFDVVQKGKSVSEEIKCRAMGDPSCEFIIRSVKK